MEFNERYESKNNNEIALSRHPGLKETLWAWCDTYGKEEQSAPLSFEGMVKILAHDKEAREAARKYLGSGPGGQRDDERGQSLLRKLAWAIVDELAAHSDQPGRSLHP